jgi:hypothetical protein
VTDFSHADVFWEALPAARRAPDRDQLESRLAEQLADAEERWPEVTVDRRRFVTHWAAQLARAGDVGTAIDQLHLSDLYLAFACAEGDTGALRAFGTLLSSVAGAVRSVDGAPSFVDEILQRLRTRVLVPDEGRTARILDYAGRGSLENWLRAGALRLALNARRDARRGPSLCPMRHSGSRRRPPPNAPWSCSGESMRPSSGARSARRSARWSPASGTCSGCTSWRA